MPQQIIGFDIDGVLTDELFPDGISVWHKEIDDYFGGVQQLQRSFQFTEAYGLEEAEVDRFMRERAESVFRKVPMREGAREVLTRLTELGFTVHLITARNSEYQEVTTQWLKRHGIPYHKLWLVKEKAPLCKELGIRFFVDDHWDNCQSLLKEQIPVVMMNMPHNELLEVPVPRVNTWDEVWGWCARVYELDDGEATA